MTTRERMERRLEHRQEWAESRDRKSASGFAKAHRIADSIPFGQPILVGHHSEKHHRADIARIDSGMRQGCESAAKAATHRSKASGIQYQLDTSIYSDDPDAIEALEAKAAALDADAERANTINKAWRKHKGAEGWANGLGLSDALVESLTKGANEYSWTKRKGPMDAAYDRANARRARQRIEQVKKRQARATEAEAAGGISIVRSIKHNWCTVTFAEKPDRVVLNALRMAGFSWGSGSWSGYLDKLPAEVQS